MAIEVAGSTPSGRRSASVRLRTTAGAVLVVGVALVAGGLALLALLDRTLTADVRTVAEIRAEEVALALQDAADPGALALPAVEEQVIQVLDENGNVTAASANVAGRPAVARLRPGDAVEVEGLLAEGPFLAVAVVAPTPDGDYTVVVARSLDDADEAVAVVGVQLAVGIPILLLVVGLTTWAVIGRALRPVEAIRAEVHQISVTQLHRRVPQPAGRDEIAGLARTMNGMLTRLDAAATRQRRFTSDAAHELRSPVASIRQHAEVALRHPGRTTVAALASTVLAEDLRVQGLVENLLLLARTDEDAARGRMEAVDLDDIVTEHARRVRATGGLQVDSTAVSGGQVRGMRAQLHALVGNLIDNAARHARSRIMLSVQTDDAAREVVLRVEDDGAGVPLAERDRIFERFVRLDESRARDEGGYGLGLAIVAGVARVHGGRTIVSEAPGGGARFEVRLPTHD